MSVSSEFGRRAADDELCAAVAKAVADGDADALRRLGLDGWGDYVQRLSELMNESVRDELDYSPDFGALMSQVASPARYAHHLVTESGTAIQKAKDTPLGIHIKPAEPDFDDDALKGTVGTAANMDDPAQAVETLADGLAYAVKKAGNDFVQANAEQRSRAGFEVSVKRSGSSKCCEWCAARIGSWALKNAPDGVFGCHANCSCVVEYTSSTGAVSQRRGTGRLVEVEYQPPHIMTHEEAREKGGFDEPKRLTGGEKGGIISTDTKTLLMQKIADGEISTQLNPEVQNRHFFGTKERQEFLDRGIEKSYFLPDVTLETLQNFLNENVGTGVLHINKKGNIEEIFNFGRDIAYDTKLDRNTPYIKVLYSKKRTHFFPYSPFGGVIE